MSNSFNVPLKLDSESSDYKREVDDEQICSCCLAGGHLINMHDRFDNDGKMESYIDAVNQCYNSEILNPVELSGKRQICDDCIERLIDSYKFKRQIIEAQKSLVDYFDERDTTQEEDDLEKREIYVMLSSDDIKHDTDDVEMDHNFEAEVEYFDPDDPPYDTKLNVLNAVSNRSSTRLSRKNNKNVKSASTKSKKNTSAKSRKASQKPTLKPPKASPSKSSSESVSKPKETRDPALPRLKKPRKQHVSRSDARVLSAMDRTNIQCLVCNERFPKVHFLSRHMNKHFANHTCEQCGKTFANSHCFAGHMRRHLVGRFECTQCDATFPTVSRMNMHRRTHRSDFSCEQCKLQFTTYHFLKHHQIKEHGYGYECKACGIKLMNPFRLRIHMQRHHSVRQKMFSCKHCTKTFYEEQGLKWHMQKHSGQRKFVCCECNKSFVWKSNLQKHLKIHYNIKDYVCTLCGLAFVQKPSLDWHMRKHTHNEKTLLNS